MNKLFIYGTLLDKTVQLEVLGRALDGRFGLIDNHILLRDWEVDGKAYPRIYPHSVGCVCGLVIEVTDEELEKIDQWESSKYIRKPIHVKENGIVETYFPIF